MTQRRSNKAIALCIVATVALLGADYASKQWAAHTLAEERSGTPPPLCEGRGYQRMLLPGVVLADGYLELQYAENCGAAFGIGTHWSAFTRKAVFTPAAFLASLGLLWMFARGSGGRFFAWSVPFVISGAVGNLIDRIRYGYVVDFIRFHVHDSFEYPTFNVADITIVIGVALLVIDGMRKDDGKKALAKTSDEAEPSEPRTETRKKRAKKSEDRSAAEG